jgi:hypothetical protein
MSSAFSQHPGRYRLATHVHLCCTADQVVLLDLRRDRYMGVGPPEMHTLAEYIQGWPTRDDVSAAAIVAAETVKVIQQLIAAGMLTSDRFGGKLAMPTAAEPPRSALIEGYVEHRSAIRSSDVRHFLTASLLARVLLRRGTVKQAIAHLQSKARRRSAASSALSDTHDLDFSFARDRVALFKRLRPLLFTARGACLFDSLALCLFLSRYRLFPRWVFGVTTRPFEAHCWVQHREVVFNDTPEHVGSFTPILVV